VTRLPRISGAVVVRALERAGFRVTHRRGSHVYLRRGDASGLVTVPVHKGRDLPVGTLAAILRQADMTAEELVELA
jgi:predicted RNA binding protein YcfA (HicA-like mRNA interferase family)